MKVLLHSAPPTVPTGYGVHTRNLIERLRKDHDVEVYSVGEMPGMLDWDGIPIYPAGKGKHGEWSIPYYYEKSEADVVFSHHDHWCMGEALKTAQNSGVPMVLYTIVDHILDEGKPSEYVVSACEDAMYTVCMTEWAYDMMKKSRIPNERLLQIPHGFDTKKYAPITKQVPKEELKAHLGIPEDAFLFGMVAANYGHRKNIGSHIEAFKKLLEDNDDIYLYVHTHPHMQNGFNLPELREMMGIDSDRVIFPNAIEMAHGIDDFTVIQLYNTFDCLLNVTCSESWGMTITEAMSCGIPVIAANNTAQTEQFNVPYDTFVSKEEQFKVTPNGLLVHRGADLWANGNNAKSWVPYVEDIQAAMEWALDNREKLPDIGKEARQYVIDNYDWDDVYSKQWKPFFAQVEKDLEGDGYNKYYFQKRDKETKSKAFRQEVEAIVPEIRGKTFLDAGCGTGTMVQVLDKCGYDAVGVEYSDAGVEVCEKKGIEVYQGDIQNLQFKDDEFDTVLSQHVLEHVDDDLEALKEMCRVAKLKVISVVPSPVVGTNPDRTEVRRYDSNTLKELKENFDKETDYTLEYEKLVTGADKSISNWMLTIELSDEDAEGIDLKPDAFEIEE